MNARPLAVLSAALTGLLLTAAAPALAQTGPSPIGGDAGTHARSNEEVRAPSVVVTDVRVASHDGFDRVVFELAGEGQAGWMIRYDDDPRADGSGDPVAVAGDAALSVILTNIAMPTEAPPGSTPWSGDVAGAGGAVAEVVDAAMFEGQHTFFVGLDRERPFRVARLQDPQRVVIDVVTAAPGSIADEDVPVGGVDTGLGGTASGIPAPAPAAVPAAVPAALAGCLLLGAGAVGVRRRVVRS